ncbi:hypothetical protein GW17_00015937 [Ensete ventricosum]|nr:hypothetical protein GW17_00015937 [Ensete ventricosum]
MLPNVRKMRSMVKIVSWTPTAVASDVGIGQKSYKKQKWRDPSAVPTFAGPARPKDGPLRLRQSDTAKVVSQPRPRDAICPLPAPVITVTATLIHSLHLSFHGTNNVT